MHSRFMLADNSPVECGYLRLAPHGVRQLRSMLHTNTTDIYIERVHPRDVLRAALYGRASTLGV